MRVLIIILLFISIGCAKPESNIIDTSNKSSDESGDNKDTTPPNEDENQEEETPDDPEEEPINGNIVCFLGETSDHKTCMVTTDIKEILRKKEYKYKKPSRFLNNPDQYRKPYHLLDLDQIDPLLYVSKNFQIGEFLVRFKGQYGILAPILIEKLQLLRDALQAPIHINSGYRSPTYNKSVGGANYSRHMYGDAVDMWSSEQSLDALKEQCIDQGASFYQLYRTHIHCDWRNHDLDPAFYPPLLEQPMSLTPMAEFQIQSELTYHKASNTVRVSHPEAEEAHDDLRYDWTIVTKQAVYTVINYQPELDLNAYSKVEKVYVDIGSAVRVEIELK